MFLLDCRLGFDSISLLLSLPRKNWFKSQLITNWIQIKICSTIKYTLITWTKEGKKTIDRRRERITSEWKWRKCVCLKGSQTQQARVSEGGRREMTERERKREKKESNREESFSWLLLLETREKKYWFLTERKRRRNPKECISYELIILCFPVLFASDWTRLFPPESVCSDDSSGRQQHTTINEWLL